MSPRTTDTPLRRVSATAAHQKVAVVFRNGSQCWALNQVASATGAVGADDFVGQATGRTPILYVEFANDFSDEDDGSLGLGRLKSGRARWRLGRVVGCRPHKAQH